MIVQREGEKEKYKDMYVNEMSAKNLNS